MPAKSSQGLQQETLGLDGVGSLMGSRGKKEHDIYFGIQVTYIIGVRVSTTSTRGVKGREAATAVCCCMIQQQHHDRCRLVITSYEHEVSTAPMWIFVHELRRHTSYAGSSLSARNA